MRLLRADTHRGQGGRWIGVTVALLAVFSVGTERVHAYIDPGTGSLLYQTAIAMVLGVGILLRIGWSSIVRAIGALFRKNHAVRGPKPRTDSR